MKDLFKLYSSYQPAGDQPAAIASLIDGLKSGLAKQTLLGLRALVKPLLWRMSFRPCNDPL